MIRVFLLDDHELVRRGVRDLLEAEGDIVVCGEAGTAAATLEGIEATAPDVAVLDVRLPDGSGVDVCRQIQALHPEVRCLVLSAFTDDEALLDAVLAGASGYVLKDVRGFALVSAVREVATGQSLLDPEVRRRALERLRLLTDEDRLLSRLTPQERRILRLLTEGLTNRQIGERMFLSDKTVKNYVSNLLVKLGMHRRTEAAVYAARHQEQVAG